MAVAADAPSNENTFYVKTAFNLCTTKVPGMRVASPPFPPSPASVPHEGIDNVPNA